MAVSTPEHSVSYSMMDMKRQDMCSEAKDSRRKKPLAVEEEGGKDVEVVKKT